MVDIGELLITAEIVVGQESAVPVVFPAKDRDESDRGGKGRLPLAVHECRCAETGH